MQMAWHVTRYRLTHAGYSVCFPVIFRNISKSPLNFLDCLSDSDIINHPSSCSLKAKYMYACCKSSDRIPHVTHFNMFHMNKNSMGRLSLFVLPSRIHRFVNILSISVWGRQSEDCWMTSDWQPKPPPPLPKHRYWQNRETWQYRAT